MLRLPHPCVFCKGRLSVTWFRGHFGLHFPMPKRLQRYYGAGYLHFITSSCYRRRALLGTPARRTLFLKTLEQVRRRYCFVVVGYVVICRNIFICSSANQRRAGPPFRQSTRSYEISRTALLVSALALLVSLANFFQKPEPAALKIVFPAPRAPITTRK